MNKYSIAAAVLSAAFGLAGPVLANPVVPAWSVVDQQGMSPGDFFAQQWVVPKNETVYVTGLYVLGANYNIYDNGIQVATTNAIDYTQVTSFTGQWGIPYTSDPNVAWATTGPDAFAHAMFAASAGDHITIQILPLNSGISSLPTNFTDGSVAISITPLPATWLMLLGGLLGLGALGYRGSRRHAGVSA